MLSTHPPNLFRRLRRFAPTPGRDAREDRLIEALAATLEGAPEAARDLVAAWFGYEAVGPLTVTTQRWVRATERLDLELVFGSTSRPDARVWLEAKVDATPYRDQAERYLRVLRELQGTRAGLAWLLPTGTVVVGDSPADVEVRTWQDLAMTLGRWVEQHAEDATAYPPRLVKQFIDHLEEEGLAVTQQLTDEDVAAVDGYELARRRLKEMFRLASLGIHQHRSRLRGKSLPAPRDIGFWEHVTHDDSWPEHALFEWRCSHDGLRHSPVGASAVSAGVSWTLGTEPSEPAYRDWFDARYADGFEYGVSRHEMVYLHRYMPLSALAQARHGSAGGLHDQSEVLTQWALESWSILETNPLPSPT